jgi:hypothetical protein
MPEADFCSAVRSPYGHLSRRSDTEQISWGKFSHFPCTVAESTFRTLMDMDFAVSRPLVRYGRLLFGFCPSTRTFVPCFLQTPPHGGSPCIITSPFLHQDGQRTFTSWLLNMPSTRRMPVGPRTNRSKAPSIYDVGREARVSVFTASAVIKNINNKGLSSRRWGVARRGHSETGLSSKRARRQAPR